MICRSQRRLALLVLSSPMLANPFVAAQSAGALDPGFAGIGIATTAVSPAPGNDRGWAVAVQADHKVVVAGYARPSVSGSDGACVAVRYEQDGSLDAGFGDGGVARFLPGLSPQVRDMAIDGGGRILVCGGLVAASAGSDWTITRLLPAGGLDSGFGQGGVVQTSFGKRATPAVRALVLQADGKLVAAGMSRTGTSQVLALARYQANGALDATFGNSGLAQISLGRNTYPDVVVGAIALQADGKVVLGGWSGSGSIWSLFRINTNGTLDTTFGSGGVTSLPATLGTGRWLGGVQVQPDGRIVTSGSVNFGNGSCDIAVARFLANGAPDASFGAGGVALAGVGVSGPFPYAEGRPCALQADGSIVVGGTALLAPGAGQGDARMITFRFLPNGTPDTSFGVFGLGQVPDSGLPYGAWSGEFGYALALGADGRIVVAGMRADGTDSATLGYRFAVARWFGH